MKIGNIEGSPEEIHSFFSINDLQIFDYLEKPKKETKKRWIFIPSSLCVLLLIVMASGIISNTSMAACIYALGLLSSIWLTLMLQIIYKKGVAFIATAFLLMLIFTAFSGLIPLKEIFEIIKAAIK